MFLKIWRYISQYSDEYFLISILLFLIIIAINTQIGWIFATSSLLASILIISAILPKLNLSKIEVKRIVPKYSFEGEKICVKLEVKNNSSFSKYLIILKDSFPACQDKNYKSLLINKIKPYETKYITYIEEAYLRGVYNFSESLLECGTPFGLFWRKKKLLCTTPLTVYPVGPEIKKISQESSLQYQMSHLKTFKTKGESFNFLGVRKYMHGDEIKFIHWPLTAKYHNLMLKEFNKPSQAYINIILDNFKDSSIGFGRENSLEYIIKIATGLSKFCCDNNIQFSLKAQDEKGFLELFKPKPNQYLNWLAKIKPAGKYNANFLLKNFQNNFQSYSQLFLITVWPNLESEILANLFNQKVFTKIILLKGYSFSENYEEEFSEIYYENTAKLLKKLKIPCKIISQGDALEKCLIG